MPSIKPTFVLVPGNWHDASLYSIFLTRLQRIGYPAVAVRIPSLAAQDSLHSDCQSDINWVRRQLLMLIDYDGQDIILICHSFGGIIGGGAAYGLSKSSRLRQGNSGGVIGLICMSAFMIPEGQSVLNYVEGKMSFDIMAINQVRVNACFQAEIYPAHLKPALRRVLHGIRCFKISLSRRKFRLGSRACRNTSSSSDEEVGNALSRGRMERTGFCWKTCVLEMH